MKATIIVLFLTYINVSIGFSVMKSTSINNKNLHSLRMAEDHDPIIIRCGVGGHGAALHARANGLKTAILTGKDVGGTCVNRYSSHPTLYTI